MSHFSDTIRVGDAFYGAAQQSDGGYTGVANPKMVVVEFGAVTTLTATGVVAAVTATVAGTNTLTATGSLVSGGVATFDIPRAVSLTSTGNNSGYSLTVTGTDQYGQTQTETITGPNNTTVNGVKAFKTVTSVTTATAVVGTMSVGTSDVYGLPNHLLNKGKFLGYKVDGVDFDPTLVVGFTATGTSTATTADVRGTVTATIASNGSRYFTAIMLVTPTTKENLYGAAPA